MMEPALNKAIPNDKWVTDGELPDPKLPKRFPGWDIMVRPLTVHSKTKSGIIVPDSVRDDLQYQTVVGKVLMVGEMAYKDKDVFGYLDSEGKENLCESWCEVGDYVSYGRFDGVKYMYRGVKVVLIRDSNVKLVIDDPRELDPNFQLVRQ